MTTLDLVSTINLRIKGMQKSKLQQVLDYVESLSSSKKEDPHFTKEELAELDRRRARYLSGESKGYTLEQSMKMLRAAQAKDEAL